MNNNDEINELMTEIANKLSPEDMELQSSITGKLMEYDSPRHALMVMSFAISKYLTEAAPDQEKALSGSRWIKIVSDALIHQSYEGSSDIKNRVLQ